MEWLLTPLGVIVTLITGLVGGAALWDRWTRFRNQITGEFAIDVLPGTTELPPSNPWDPPLTGMTDGIIVQATVHNNTSGPIVVTKWVVEGPPLENDAVAHREVIEAGKTGIAATQFVPNWRGWDQQLEAGLTQRALPRVRVSLVALSRTSSRHLTLRSTRFRIGDEIVRANAVAANTAPDSSDDHRT